MRRLRSLPLLLSLLLIGCQNPTAQRFLKAKGTKVSPFLDQRPQMRPSRDRVPFNAAWRNTAPSVQARVMEMTELYIAPVELRYLQPVSKKLARWEMENGWTPRRERETAVELRRVFAQAFLTSPRPRYRIVTKPSDRSVTLEIAITELNPTSVRGNGVKLAAKFLVGPLSGVLGVFTKGNIAIEGKVSLSKSKAPVFQFCDNEKDKMTLYSARDFQPYAHAQVAIREWAAQFEEFTRTYSDHKVKESSFITLKPW